MYGHTSVRLSLHIMFVHSFLRCAALQDCRPENRNRGDDEDDRDALCDQRGIRLLKKTAFKPRARATQAMPVRIQPENVRSLTRTVRSSAHAVRVLPISFELGSLDTLVSAMGFS